LEYWYDNAKLATPNYIALLRFYLDRFARNKEINWKERVHVLGHILKLMDTLAAKITLMKKASDKPTWNKLLVALPNEILQVSLFAPLKTMVEKVSASIDFYAFYKLLVSNMKCFGIELLLIYY
jgi:predicted GNAT family acetyltransferase